MESARRMLERDASYSLERKRGTRYELDRRTDFRLRDGRLRVGLQSRERAKSARKGSEKLSPVLKKMVTGEKAGDARVN